MEKSMLNVIGTSGASVVNSDPLKHGPDGEPLGPDGDGHDGVEQWFECKTQATAGQRGNDGETGPSGDNGENGTSVYGLRFVCAEFNGDTFSLTNRGGDGGHGGDGGPGGNGSDGGKAGSQPKHCTKFVAGGRGGTAGSGGAAGSGGKAGSAADVTALVGSALDSLPISDNLQGGTGGMQGAVGGPGEQGKGGMNSDGTFAPSGGDDGSGAVGHGGKGGYGGSFVQKTDPNAGPKSLTITFVPRQHG